MNVTSKRKVRHSPSSLHSSGGFAFLASLGSSHDVVLVLWLRRDDRERARVCERECDRWQERGDLAERKEEVGGFLIQPENHCRGKMSLSCAAASKTKATDTERGEKKVSGEQNGSRYF